MRARPRPRRPARGRRRPRRGPRARRGDPARHRPRRRRGLPALRRHHRRPEADPAPARRVLVQRPRLRRGPRLDRRRPRRAPHPDHPQRRDRVRRPRPAQRRRLPRAHRPRPRHRHAAPRRRAHHLGALRPRALPRAGRTRSTPSSRARCASSCSPARRSPRSSSRRRRRGGARVGQLFGMAEGMFLVTPLDASPGAAPHDGRGADLAARRGPGARAGQRGRGPRRRGGRAVLPGPVHAARLLRRRGATSGSATAFTSDGFYRTGRPREGPSCSTGTARSRSRAASRTSSTAAARRSTPRRSSCCCSRTRTSSRPRSSRCPTRGSGSGAAPPRRPTAPP